MVALQIISDLHLENPKAYDIFEITPKAPYLALLGDIGYLVRHEADYLGFLKRQLTKFRAVFLVLGNHEPWHSTWDDCLQTTRRWERELHQEGDKQTGLGQFVVLNRDRYDIERASGDAVIVLGCTLFSHVPSEAAEAVSFGVNDFYHTVGWDLKQYNAAFERDLAWLNAEVTALRGAGRTVVVLTHYSPTLDERAADPRHRTSAIGSGFATDLSAAACWRSSDVKLWAFGHTHFNCDFVDEETGKRVVANQRGYYFAQSEGFIGDKVVEI
ncbi:Ser/Thr protein phosphatase superfamily [Hypoxylon rubiginosum]|uniref:Ser/Thr protein phosphatase superfamily n=1 Tax=Hypoxylon rubiginosum TaxID=110542 RepID=A0ACB9YPC1_9PEZI|nr:Ser/Thr protein phosphatase superfamily [Hypoxylon rubiginosum]